MFSSRSNLSSLSKQNMELEKRRKEAVFLGALENRKQVKQISIVKSVGSEIDVYYSSNKYTKGDLYKIREPKPPAQLEDSSSSFKSHTISDFLNPNFDESQEYSASCVIEADSTMDILQGDDVEFFYFVKLKATKPGKMVIRFGDMFNVELNIYEEQL
ncbi:predicted protein [Naegleria gruberi]|uniref:Predicted protein n=1 Tax=Naegleria gruberi TaxID=5762 RepID=D2VLJ3_NAEGR|nr:uncharacterized protein NAEGRDRAFT_69799 [Naegleria gruberi]EFC42398.1 predicted protein [Naegleria gruberi]|eukprot:XP_002675142.1 predicted protein [Naegleria gruberi strain NEG-M]